MLMADTLMTDDWIKKMWAKFPCKPSTVTEGNFIIGPCRISYPKLFERGKARSNGQQGDYGILALLPMGADISIVEKACAALVKAKWPSAGTPEGKRLKLKGAIKDQADLEGRPGSLEGAKMFNANAKKNQPRILDQYGQDLKDKDLVYPGCWGIPVVRPYTYDVDNSRGVTLGLQSITILNIRDNNLGSGGGSSGRDFEGMDFSGIEDPNAVFGGEEGGDDSAAMEELYG